MNTFDHHPTAGVLLEAAQREVVAFVREPDRRVLTLRVDAGAVDLAAETIATMGRAELADAALITASAADIGGALPEALRAVVRRETERAGLGDDVPVFDQTLPPAVAAAAFAEACAFELRQLVARLLLVVTVDTETPADARAILKIFSVLLRTPHARLLIVDASSSVVVPEETPALRRIEVVEVAPTTLHSRSELERIIEAHRAAVIVAVHGNPATTTLLRQLTPGPVLEWCIPYARPGTFLKALADRVEGESSKGRLTYRRPADAPPLGWVWKAMDTLRRATAPDAVLAVVIDPQPVAQPEKLAALIESFADLPLYPRLKLVFLDRRGAIARAVQRTRLTARVLGVDPEALKTARASDPGLSEAERHRLLLACGAAALLRGDIAGATDHARQARAIAANADERALTLLLEGQAAYQSGDLARSAVILGRGIELAQSDALTSATLAGLGLALAGVHLVRGDHREAVELYELAAQLCASSGQNARLLTALVWSGEAHRRMGKPEVAEATWTHALERLEQASPRFQDQQRALRAELLERRARVLDELGREADARELRERSSCACKEFAVAERP